MPNGRDPTRSILRGRRGRYDSYNWSHFSDVPPSSTGTEAIDMAAYLKLLGESLCSIGMCLKRQVRNSSCVTYVFTDSCCYTYF